MINKITSIQVRYAPHLEEDLLKNAEENAPSPEQMNAHWADPTKMLVSYRGPLSGLLDEIGSRFGIWWRYDKNEIYFYKFMTKTFVLYSLPTKQSLSSNIGGSSTDSGSGGSSSLTLTNTAELELWSNIEKSITSMIGKDAQLSLDPTNGTISLTATPNESDAWLTISTNKTRVCPVRLPSASKFYRLPLTIRTPLASISVPLSKTEKPASASPAPPAAFRPTLLRI